MPSLANYRRKVRGVKCSCSAIIVNEMQCQVTDQCLQLFGGYGYTTEYPISRFYVD